uniref:Putative ovule protein n=1 Tax=Solanum chacoense TaxID=4108 RepID=A0A0V0HB88_SOLCH
MEADELQPQKPRDNQERESNNADIQFQEFIHSATEIDDQSQEPMRDQQENLNDQEPCFVCNAVMVWESKRNCTGCSLTPLFPPEKEEELKEITAVYPLSKLRKICKTNPL